MSSKTAGKGLSVKGTKEVWETRDSKNIVSGEKS
jgi:hypothetical protein